VNNDQFNTGISASMYNPPWDILPDLGDAAGRRGSTWLDNSVRHHFFWQKDSPS
jgi:hypothetical protein